MSDYVAPDPEVAAYVHEQQAKLEQERERLATSSEEELKTIAYSTSGPEVRIPALSVLMDRIIRSSTSRQQMEGPLVELLGGLLEDTQKDVAQLALRHCPLTSDDKIEKARSMLSSPEVRVRASAAMSLAKIKDEAANPTFLDWFHNGDEAHRNLGIETLKTLASDAAKHELKSSYENGGRNEQDRAVLAVALLRLGDTVGLSFLKEVGERATGPLSVMAATWIYSVHDTDIGLRLMLDILDRGDLEAKRSLVMQICHSWLHSPHASTADAIHEARLWIERKLESPDKRPTPFFPRE